jgi:1-phosphofructokinase family hexose kinase
MIYTVTLNPTIDRTMHLDALRVGELNRATRSRIDLSGKGVNVSVALRRFGVDSVMVGFAGGIAGRLLVDGLRDAGHTCAFRTVSGETRSNLTVIDTGRGITTKLNEPGPTVTAEDIAGLEADLVRMVKTGDRVILSGSLPPGAPPDTYARLIRACHSCGAGTVLDTSGPPMALGCRAAPDLIKPNDGETAELVGLPLDTPAQWVTGLDAMRALGPKRVLLSLGSRGAALAIDDEVWLAVPPAIREVSAIGAGDASLAGALYAWNEGLTPAEMVRWGVATGTATAMEDGTIIPSRDSIHAVWQQVQVSCLRGSER